MNELQNTPPKPPSQLTGFDSYEDFLSFAKSRFALQPEEYESLYNVMLKLQSVGVDPLSAMQDCQSQLVDGECLDMLKFMMFIDGLDIKDLKQ